MDDEEDPMDLDLGINVSELVSKDLIRLCEQMKDIYPSGMENMTLEVEEELEELGTTAVKVPAAPQLTYQQQENPLPPSPPPNVQLSSNPSRFNEDNTDNKHPLHIRTFSKPPEAPETSGQLIIEPPCSSHSVASGGKQRRRSPEQTKTSNPDKKKKEKDRQRDRYHSANYLAKKKELMAELEESSEILKAQLKGLEAKNFRIVLTINTEPTTLLLLKNKINRKISTKHRRALKEKQKTVKALETALDEIEYQEIVTNIKKTTLASRRSRTNQKLRTAMLDLGVLETQMKIEVETMLGKDLEKIQKKETFKIASMELGNADLLEGAPSEN